MAAVHACVGGLSAVAVSILRGRVGVRVAGDQVRIRNVIGTAVISI
jgi:hypothetical protein